MYIDINESYTIYYLALFSVAVPDCDHWRAVNTHDSDYTPSKWSVVSKYFKGRVHNFYNSVLKQQSGTQMITEIILSCHNVLHVEEVMSCWHATQWIC